MQTLSSYEKRNTVVYGARGMVLGAALVAFGVIGFGAYSFAAGGDQPKPVAAQQVSTAAVRTTPEGTTHAMPPPVAPTKTP